MILSLLQNCLWQSAISAEEPLASVSQICFDWFDFIFILIKVIYLIVHLPVFCYIKLFAFLWEPKTMIKINLKREFHFSMIFVFCLLYDLWKIDFVCDFSICSVPWISEHNFQKLVHASSRFSDRQQNYCQIRKLKILDRKRRFWDHFWGLSYFTIFWQTCLYFEISFSHPSALYNNPDIFA